MQGQLVSHLGNQAFTIGSVFWLKEYKNSGFLVGAMLTLSIIPGILLGPEGGAVADYFSRKKILIYTDLISSLLVGDP